MKMPLFMDLCDILCALSMKEADFMDRNAKSVQNFEIETVALSGVWQSKRVPSAARLR